MFVHVILVHVVQMTIVKIIYMAVMTNRGVPAFQAMLVSVVGMVFLGACGHWRCSLHAWFCPRPIIPSNNGIGAKVSHGKGAQADPYATPHAILLSAFSQYLPVPTK
jgi:hypothetical protein